MTVNLSNLHDSEHGQDDDVGSYLEIRRPVYRTQTFRSKYLKTDDSRPSFSETIQKKVRDLCTCTPRKGKKCIFSCLPCLRILRKYKIRSDLPNDLISGLTVGVMQLPQAMAYAMLADMPPVVGLYMSFFPVLIYFLFGTCKQISMGTVAVVSLMTGGIVSREAIAWRKLNGFSANATVLNGTSADGALETTFAPGEVEFRISVAASIAFISGLMQIVMGIGRIGFVTTYMSDSLISGFTTGAAAHVFTSQVKYILGLKIPRFKNMFQIINTYRALALNITKTNIAEVVISFICIIIIYLVKVQVNQRFRSKLKIPIPVELVVVIFGTIGSHYGGFRDKYHIRVVGHIPAGLPNPAPPSFTNVNQYGLDCFAIAVVAFAQSVSLAVLMAKKHHYDIDSNKELLAYGFGNVFGSFFSCYPFAASVSRSSVQDSAGGKTQVASVFSASLVLVVILFIGPLFESLPNCILSAIIVVALRSMFLQILELRHLYKISIYDCAIWLVTFVAVVVLHVDMGLFIGIVFSFFTVVIRTQLVKATSLEKVSDVEVLQSESLYEKTEQYPGVRVVGFNAPLYYANGDLFMKHVYRVTGVKPERLRKTLKKLQKEDSMRLHSQQNLIRDGTVIMQIEANKADGVSNGAHTKSDEEIEPRRSVSKPPDAAIIEDPRPFHHIVIDCSSMHFMDPVGIKVLKQLFHEYNNVGISVFIGGVRDDVWQTLEYTDFVEKYHDCIFLTVYDAALAAQEDSKANNHVQDVEQTTEIADESSADDKLLSVRT